MYCELNLLLEKLQKIADTGAAGVQTANCKCRYAIIYKRAA